MLGRLRSCNLVVSSAHGYRALGGLEQRCNLYENRRGFAKKSKGKRMAASKGGGKGQAAAAAEDKETTEFFLRLLQAPAVERKEPLSEEEKERRRDVARAYSLMKFKQDVERKKANLLRSVLMESAIEALPTEEMRKEALTPDYTPFPMFRHAPFWTPPTEAREGGKIK